MIDLQLSADEVYLVKTALHREIRFRGVLSESSALLNGVIVRILEAEVPNLEIGASDIETLVDVPIPIVTSPPEDKSFGYITQGTGA